VIGKGVTVFRKGSDVTNLRRSSWGSTENHDRGLLITENRDILSSAWHVPRRSQSISVFLGVAAVSIVTWLPPVNGPDLSPSGWCSWTRETPPRQCSHAGSCLKRSPRAARSASAYQRRRSQRTPHTSCRIVGQSLPYSYWSYRSSNPMPKYSSGSVDHISVKVSPTPAIISRSCSLRSRSQTLHSILIGRKSEC
jgi:hypothetical protein